VPTPSHRQFSPIFEDQTIRCSLEKDPTSEGKFTMRTSNTSELLPKVGVGAMIMRAGKVLLGRRRGAHGDGTYAWCGGHVEFGETLEACAIREVQEETGLAVVSLELLCVSNIIAYGKHYIDFEFLTEVAPGEPQVKEPDRIESWAWYALDQLPSPLFKAGELALQSYRTGQFYHP
jgi:8-oxo-dGTP diphosphatase